MSEYFFGSDEQINQEIDDIGREILTSANKVRDDIIGFSRKHPSVGVESMPLCDFLEEIKEVDSGFDQDTVGLINNWIENHPEDINLEKPVRAFLVEVSEEINKISKENIKKIFKIFK